MHGGFNIMAAGFDGMAGGYDQNAMAGDDGPIRLAMALFCFFILLIETAILTTSTTLWIKRGLFLVI